MEKKAKDVVEQFIDNMDFGDTYFSPSEIKAIQKGYKESLKYQIEQDAQNMAITKAHVIVEDLLNKKNLGKKKPELFLTDEEVLEMAKKRNLIP